MGKTHNIIKNLVCSTMAFSQDNIDRSPKRGMAEYGRYPLSKYTSLPSGKTSSISWFYNWQDRPRHYELSPLEYVPMVWGEAHLESIDQQTWKPEDHTFSILGFNEPELPIQANMTPQRAVELWPKIEAMANKVRPRLQIGSPAICCDLDWMTTFLELCERRNCVVDFLAFHIYAETPCEFANRLNEIQQRFKRWPIWITEFGYGYTTNPNNDGAALTLLREATRLLDGTSQVKRYAWFGLCDGPGYEVTNDIGRACRDTDTRTQEFTDVGMAYYFP